MPVDVEVATGFGDSIGRYAEPIQTSACHSKAREQFGRRITHQHCLGWIHTPMLWSDICMRSRQRKKTFRI